MSGYVRGEFGVKRVEMVSFIDSHCFEAEDVYVYNTVNSSPCAPPLVFWRCVVRENPMPNVIQRESILDCSGALVQPRICSKYVDSVVSVPMALRLSWYTRSGDVSIKGSMLPYKPIASPVRVAAFLIHFVWLMARANNEDLFPSATAYELKLTNLS